MTSTALTSELEAINTILECCDEAPVASLALSGLYPLDKAKGCLSEASRSIQALGWQFNTEEDYTVPLDGTSKAALPVNALSFDVDEQKAPNGVVLVQRGLGLYDKANHTYVLSQAPVGTIVFLLGWDELPEAARRFITIKACRLMQGRSSVTEGNYKYSQEDEQLARAELEQWETSTGDHNFLRDSDSVSSVLLNHY